MSVTCEGWIEIRDPKMRWWSGVISVLPLHLQDYVVLGSIFGVQWGSSDPERGPFAVDRGLPVDASGRVRDEEPHDPDNFRYSWVLWSELEDTWLATERKSPDGWPMSATWIALRGMMAALAEYVGSENVRLVLWFC